MMYFKSKARINRNWGFNIKIVDNDCDTYPFLMNVESVYLSDGSTDDMALSDCFETLKEAFNDLSSTIEEAIKMCESKQEV